MKAGGKGLVIEHVAQQDQVKGFSPAADDVFRETHRRLHTVQFTVHLCGNSSDCNTKRAYSEIQKNDGVIESLHPLEMLFIISKVVKVQINARMFCAKC